jgi:septal ring factor EnvC (AmiA/AmiB activator)
MITLASIEETNRLLQENTRTVSNALNRLNLLIQQISSRRRMIQLLNQEISAMENEIRSKEQQIRTLERDLETKKQQYATSVRKMYLQKNNQDLLLFILSSKSFAQSYHRIMYLRAYSGWRKNQAEEIVEKQESINRERDQLIAQRNNRQSLLNTRQTEENQLRREEGTRQAEVRTLERNNRQLRDELAVKQRQANALNQQIQRIIAEEVRMAQQAARTEGGTNRAAEVRGGYAMTESERALSASFAENRGRLPFPLTGSYRVVSNFGVNRHRELSRVVVNNNGIDIETTAGNDARAIFNGVISRIFTLPGYNNSIIVRHGNYLTLYSNLDQVYVRQGDRVSTGQPLGKIYTDREKGNSTLLHFEIWREQTKLDPMVWIRR